MADRLAAAVLIHFNSLKASCGIPASVTRGAATIEPTVVLGRADVVAKTTREFTYSADSQDVLIGVADYSPLGEPQDGDRIEYEEAGQMISAVVRPPDENMPCFTRWRGGAVFRVHCKISERDDV